jgi:hypothetical protein
LGHRQVLVPIVRIILTQAARFRRRGAISETVFQAQVSRIGREELEPRGFTLVVRDLPCGTTRFIVKSTTNGAVCDLLDCETE